MLALQGDVALAIAQEIGTQVTPQEQRRIGDARTLDPEAYRLYVLGHQLRQKQTEAELYEALDHFRRSLKIDPGYARAYWGIAETWISLAGWTGFVPPREGFPRAKAAAQQALALDSAMAEAHASLALVTEVYDWDMAGAERLYREALALSPNDALTHERYSLHLFRTRRSDEGLTQAQRAFELNPLSSDNNIALATRLFSGGRRDEGLAAMRKATELAPLYYDGWVHLGEMYNFLGRPEEAIAAVRHGIDLSDGGSHAIQMLASVFVKQGKRAEAEALLRPLEARPTHRNPYEIAMLRLSMGDTDAALRWFLSACEERTPQMGFFSFVKNDTVFDPIRRDPRFDKVAGCGDPDGSRQ
jgi:tetratricopeptide (TPR) repeat protein